MPYLYLQMPGDPTYWSLIGALQLCGTPLAPALLAAPRCVRGCGHYTLPFPPAGLSVVNSPGLCGYPAGLIAAVQAVVPGQENTEGAAILVTGGSLALVAENHNMVSQGAEGCTSAVRCGIVQ